MPWNGSVAARRNPLLLTGRQTKPSRSRSQKTLGHGKLCIKTKTLIHPHGSGNEASAEGMIALTTFLQPGSTESSPPGTQMNYRSSNTNAVLLCCRVEVTLSKHRKQLRKASHRWSRPHQKSCHHTSAPPSSKPLCWCSVYLALTHLEGHRR